MTTICMQDGRFLDILSSSQVILMLMLLSLLHQVDRRTTCGGCNVCNLIDIRKVKNLVDSRVRALVLHRLSRGSTIFHYFIID